MTGKVGVTDGHNRVHPMTYEELDTFLKAAHAQCGPRDRLFFLTMADTGIRPGEAAALQWVDVDCALRKLRVQRALTEDAKGKLTTTERIRTVDLSHRLVGALQHRRDELEEAAMLAGRELSPWLFPSDQGDRPLSLKVMTRLFADVRQAAGLPHYTLYDLRHTYAAHLLMERADLLYVAHQLGHSNPTTTLSQYAPWMPSGDKAQLDRMMAVRLTKQGPHNVRAIPPAVTPEWRSDVVG